jgi:hypothetical protein
MQLANCQRLQPDSAYRVGMGELDPGRYASAASIQMKPTPLPLPAEPDRGQWWWQWSSSASGEPPMARSMGTPPVLTNRTQSTAASARKAMFSQEV